MGKFMITKFKYKIEYISKEDEKLFKTIIS